MKWHHPSGKPSDVYNWYGMTVAWTMVETIATRARTRHVRASSARRTHST